MKNLVSLLLAFTLVIGLCACGASGNTGPAPETTQATAAVMKVGYAKTDITPTDSVPLAGYGNSKERMSKGMLDYLYATCVYIEDAEGSAVLLMAMDLPNLSDPLKDYRVEIAKALDMEENRVMFCASHTHSAPDTKLAKSIPSQSKYNTMLREKLEETARAAIADAMPVTGMYTSVIETESLNFVRRYVMVDGSYAGDNYGDHNLGYAGHESDPDTTLQLLKFTREGGKDVIMSNFQTHPHLSGGSKRYDVSSDLVGVYRAEIEQSLDCNAIYFSGSSGNINPTSRIKEEVIYKDHRSHGKALAGYALQAAEQFVALELGAVRVADTTYVGTVNHSQDELLAYAQEVVDRKESGMSNSQALEGYEQYGISSTFHAGSIVTKAGLPETLDVRLYGLAVGDFSMVFAPFELFSDLGVMIKEGSKFDATFVCCYANDLFSYMPTQLGFDHGGYGPGQCKFVPGTGEELVSEYLQILDTLHTAQ